jgi:hypothetical protein
MKLKSYKILMNQETIKLLIAYKENFIGPNPSLTNVISKLIKTWEEILGSKIEEYSLQTLLYMTDPIDQTSAFHSASEKIKKDRSMEPNKRYIGQENDLLKYIRFLKDQYQEVYLVFENGEARFYGTKKPKSVTSIKISSDIILKLAELKDHLPKQHPTYEDVILHLIECHRDYEKSRELGDLIPDTYIERIIMQDENPKVSEFVPNQEMVKKSNELTRNVRKTTKAEVVLKLEPKENEEDSSWPSNQPKD